MTSREDGGKPLDAALAYAARGWAVFPCHPNDKQPLVPKSSSREAKDGGLYLATCDEAKIRAWWRTRPGAMIGLRMGPGVGAFVLDFDPKTDPVTGEVTTVTDLVGVVETLIGEALPATLTSATPRGGRHMLFGWPGEDVLAGETIGNSRGAIPSKMIDVRGEGGYIVIAPSVRHGPKAVEEGCDGVAYRWLDPDAPIAAAPPALVDAVLRRGRFAPAAAPRSAPSSRPASPAGDAEEEAVRRYALAALDHAVRDVVGAPAGQRNQAINDRALSIGHLVGAGALSRSVAHAALYDACASWGIAANDKAIRPGGTLDRALDDGARTPADLAHVRDGARERAARRQGASAPPADLPPLEGYAAPDAGSPAAPRRFDDGFASGDEAEGSEAPSETLGGAGGRTGAIDMAVVRECSALDHSDTDNGRRLIAHFGADLRVFQTSGERNAGFVVWGGTHWNLDTGKDAAFAMAQQVGGLIALEADFLAQTPAEARAIEEGEAAAATLAGMDARRGEWTDADKATARRLSRAVDDGEAARDALDRRKVARRKFGVSSKNAARLKAMLECAAPMLLTPPEAFNRDPLVVATRTHTLRFRRTPDLECPDPDVARWTAECIASECHRREDLITRIIDLAYDPAAACPRLDEFMARFLPVEPVRRFVQVTSGLGLLGSTVQKLVFHYGEGANGKSVYLQTIANVLGAVASTLSPDAITGSNQRQGNQASPELARLFGKRFVRVSELPEGVPLQEELVKRLSGGEDIPVRNLFQGIFDFHPEFIGHMSGNGYPRIEGTNNGIWRRMAVVHWPVTLAEDEQKPFDEVIDGFRREYPGILNWLVQGALIYLAEGLYVPPEVTAATKEYRDEMDPIGPFCEACVEVFPDGIVQAREMYEAYVSWAMANGVKPIHETRFGKTMKTRFKRDDGRIRYYHDCRLHDVPTRPDAPRSPPGGFID